jgi:hypothetical protein
MKQESCAIVSRFIVLHRGMFHCAPAALSENEWT